MKVINCTGRWLALVTLLAGGTLTAAQQELQTALNDFFKGVNADLAEGFTDGSNPFLNSRGVTIAKDGATVNDINAINLNVINKESVTFSAGGHRNDTYTPLAVAFNADYKDQALAIALLDNGATVATMNSSSVAAPWSTLTSSVTGTTYNCQTGSCNASGAPVVTTIAQGGACPVSGKSCASGLTCNTGFSGGQCQPQQANNSPCGGNGDCTSGNCQGGKCASSAAQPLAVGATCSAALAASGSVCPATDSSKNPVQCCDKNGVCLAGADASSIGAATCIAIKGGYPSDPTGSNCNNNGECCSADDNCNSGSCATSKGYCN